MKVESAANVESCRDKFCVQVLKTSIFQLQRHPFITKDYLIKETYDLCFFAQLDPH